MSNATPMILIFVLLIGGVVAWGAMTDWTFSGLLPRKGAKCTPDKDEKDANATEYVYDEDEKCLVVKKCKKGWEPNTANTACIYSDQGEVCTPKGTPIINGKYTFDDDKICNLVGCNNDFKSPNCDTCIDGYTKDGTVCRKCKAADVTLPTDVTLNLIKNVDGQTYKTEGGKCIPNRQVFPGNNGTTSCEVYCSGNNTPEGAPWVATFSEWKGAKCVGTAKADGTKLKGSDECRNWGWKPTEAAAEDKHCLCERNDSVPWYGNEFTMPTTFESHQLAAGWSTGTGNSGGTGEYYGDELASRTLVECREHARSKGYPAFGVRTDPTNTCWGYKAGWTKTAEADPNGPATNHYTECVDPTKKVKNSCK